MISQNSILKEPVMIIGLVAISLGILGAIITWHDNIYTLDQATDKSTISWIDSQTECRWLDQYYTDLGIHGKWFKSNSDNELIMKMKELKC